MHALSGSMPLIQSLTCWEPQFDLAELALLRRVRRLTLLRLAFNDAVVRQVLRFVEESGRRCAPLEKIALEFVVQV